jgi:SAM-dependent methyltransferase
MVHRSYHDRGWRHAYKLYEDLIAQATGRGQTILDAGCGRNFPMVTFLMGLGATVYGFDDEADPDCSPPGVTMANGDLAQLPFDDEMFDVICTRSVLEHLSDPGTVFAELRRVLKPGGRLVFLTPNRYDYVSVGAMIMPHRLRQRLVRRLEGRDETDAFPVYYRANSKRRLRRLARRTGMTIQGLDYHNCYPALFMHHPILCRMGIAWDKLVANVRPLNWLQGWLIGTMRRDDEGPQGQ